MAGWTVLLSDCEIDFAWGRARSEHNDQQWLPIHDVAQTLLGLARWQADTMFLQCADLDALWHCAEGLTDGELRRVTP